MKVIIDDPVRYEGDFHDGFFVFNEDWFNHRNASINFFPYDGEPDHRAFDQMNPGYCLGETGVTGYAWGDNIFLTCLGSKDPGELNQGIKSATIDVATMQLIEPVYPGNVAYDTDKFYPDATIRAGKYVYKVPVRSEESAPTEIYAPFTDTLVKTLDTGCDVQVVAQDSEGKVWLLCATDDRGYLQCIDPVNLEISRVIEVPEAKGFTSKALWYQAPRFFASPSEQALFFLKSTSLYRCEISGDEFSCR